MAIVYIPQYSGEAARQYLIERGYELIERSDKVCDTDALSVSRAVHSATPASSRSVVSTIRIHIS